MMTEKKRETRACGVDSHIFSEHVRTEKELVRLALKAARMAEESNLSRRQIARKMGMKSPSTVQRVVSGENTTLETLMRFASACGYRLELKFVPLVQERKMPDVEVFRFVSSREWHAADQVECNEISEFSLDAA